MTKTELKEMFREVLREELDRRHVTPRSRDDIDAIADDKKERARAAFARRRDDADSDRDYQLKRNGMKEAACKLRESDKAAALSIEDAQKWVDFDMKRYGRISDRTNDLVKKAGFDIVRDEYGDYEVVAGDYEDHDHDYDDYDEDDDMEESLLGAGIGLGAAAAGAGALASGVGNLIHGK